MLTSQTTGNTGAVNEILSIFEELHGARFHKNKREIALKLHKATKHNFERRIVIFHGKNDPLPLDLVEMIFYSKKNKVYKYILRVTDWLTKYAWAIPLKS